MENLYSDSSIIEMVELPSRGKLYGGKLPDGKVRIRAMTAKEEKLIYGSKSIEKIKAFLHACVVLPAGLSFDELLISDSFFLTMKIRILSLGSEYPIQVCCPTCDSQFTKSFDLASLNVKYYEEKEEKLEPFLVALPIAGKTLGFRMLRVKDQEAIYKYAKNKGIKDELGESGYVYSIARSLVSLDQKPLSQLDALNLAEQMVSKDTTALRYAMEDNDCGIDTNIVLECPKCGFILESMLPVNDEFFRPKQKRIRSSIELPV